MARGGYRAGAGRPKSAAAPKEPGKKPGKRAVAAAKATGIPADVIVAAKGERKTPLEYMLDVMNNTGADSGRRDRMAVAAAPFVHARASDMKPGKKEQADDAARSAGEGSEWGDDLAAPGAAHLN